MQQSGDGAFALPGSGAVQLPKGSMYNATKLALFLGRLGLPSTKQPWWDPSFGAMERKLGEMWCAGSLVNSSATIVEMEIARKSGLREKQTRGAMRGAHGLVRVVQ